MNDRLDIIRINDIIAKNFNENRATDVLTFDDTVNNNASGNNLEKTLGLGEDYHKSVAKYTKTFKMLNKIINVLLNTEKFRRFIISGGWNW